MRGVGAPRFADFLRGSEESKQLASTRNSTFAPPGLGSSVVTGLLLGFVVGSVAGILDPLVTAHGCAWEWAVVLRGIVKSIAVIVPVSWALGGIVGIASYALSLVSRRAYGAVLKMLPGVWVAAIFAYILIAYYGPGVGRISVVKSAIMALLVGMPTYLALAALCTWMRRGQVKRVMAVLIAVSVGLWASLAIWLISG